MCVWKGLESLPVMQRPKHRIGSPLARTSQRTDKPAKARSQPASLWPRRARPELGSIGRPSRTIVCARQALAREEPSLRNIPARATQGFGSEGESFEVICLDARQPAYRAAALLAAQTLETGGPANPDHGLCAAQH